MISPHLTNKDPPHQLYILELENHTLRAFIRKAIFNLKNNYKNEQKKYQ